MPKPISARVNPITTPSLVIWALAWFLFLSLNPESYTLNPEPQTLNLMGLTQAELGVGPRLPRALLRLCKKKVGDHAAISCTSNRLPLSIIIGSKRTESVRGLLLIRSKSS